MPSAESRKPSFAPAVRTLRRDCSAALTETRDECRQVQTFENGQKIGKPLQIQRTARGKETEERCLRFKKDFTKRAF